MSRSCSRESRTSAHRDEPRRRSADRERSKSSDSGSGAAVKTVKILYSTGVIKTVLEEKGFGFIKRSEGDGGDVWFRVVCFSL